LERLFRAQPSAEIYYEDQPFENLVSEQIYFEGEGKTLTHPSYISLSTSSTMSYDLYFYKPQGSPVTEKEIARYLSIHAGLDTENTNEWFFENKATEAYYSFNLEEENDSPEDIELYNSFESYHNTRFSFNLNFMRPSFFGREAFRFVDQLMRTFDLFVLNPQSSQEDPYKATPEELFDNWNQANLRASSDHFKDLNCIYLPEEQSNEIWEYNSKIRDLQEQLGQGYFVPKIFLFKTKADNRTVTITSWTQHIPCILPPVDYVFLVRTHKTLLKSFQDQVIISMASLMKSLGTYFEDYPIKGCKIIHPANSTKAKKPFNAMQAEEPAGFAERIPIENVYNAK
jgi:hypothetical protein